LKIPFVKAHGAHNDFLLTWRDSLPLGLTDMAATAVAICERHTGVGADGWILLDGGAAGVPCPAGTQDQGVRPTASIELWNSDGSRSEISGNGTRCAAALLIDAGHASDEILIATGAGIKALRLLGRQSRTFNFEMNMGSAVIEQVDEDRVMLNVGNPQCAVFVPDFNLDWRGMGAALERDSRFPHRTNVSFVRVVDQHSLEARFFERGAGETMSSGTGSTGAAAAAIARGFVTSPVRALTPAGPLDLRLEGPDFFLAGPAEIVAEGEYYLHTA